MAYRAFRIKLVMSCRIALRNGADGSSILEALLGSLVTGHARNSHQVGLQESWSSLLSCPLCIQDGPLLLNCCVAVADAAFAPLGGGGAKEKWRSLKRGSDPLSLLASTCEEVCRQINSGKTLEEIIQEKSLRQDLFDKYIQVIQEDTHEERRAYAPELASYAAEILAGLGAEVDLTPSQEKKKPLPFR